MKQYYRLLLVLAFSIGLLSACKSDDTNKPTDCSEVHWSYAGETGPDKWPDLCSGFSACGHNSQSPIDITGATDDSSLGAIAFNYGTTKVEIENNGHTIEFVCEPGSKLSISNTEYELLQFHYHGLSEHKVEGQHYPLEVHFVNRASDDNYAVIGVFYEEGEENPLFAEFLEHFPHQAGVYEDHSKEIDLMTIFPENRSYYNYSGSLTTPPCSEIVNWYVLKSPVTASAAQIAEFQDILHNNYRPVQALNGRTVAVYNE